MSLYDTAIATRWGYRDISPQALHDAGSRPLIIDVREPHEYATGHVPGSHLVPFDCVPDKLGSWSLSADIVVVCRSGRRSAKIAEALTSSGFHRVMNLAGGILAYAAAGLPIAR